jgi:tripartite-type tricarboxylate transporter receptor subunit TctC
MSATIRRLSTILLSIGVLAPGIECHSQPYPSKPMRIITPAAPGAGLAVRTRELANKLTEMLGQPVVVENRPGAGGVIAMNAVAKASADGYTMAVSGTGAVAYYSALYRNLPYSAEDFAPVSLLATGPMAIYSQPALAANSVKELIAITKSKPGVLTFASPGVGTIQHLAGELFKQQSGADLRHIPYKEYALILSDVESGRVSLLFDSTGAVQPHVQAGKLKAFAITGTQRLPILPGVPTFSEAGMPTYGPEISYGVFVPAGTPRAIINTLSAACVKAYRSGDIPETIGRFGFIARSTTPKEYAAFIVEERNRWAAVLRTTGFQLDL